MAYLRQLSSHFDPVYLKPANLAKAVRYWQTSINTSYSQPQTQLPPRRQQDRRCGVERRQRQLPVFLDTRSPYARRKIAMRRQHDGESAHQVGTGIDIYV